MTDAVKQIRETCVGMTPEVCIAARDLAMEKLREMALHSSIANGLVKAIETTPARDREVVLLGCLIVMIEQSEKAMELLREAVAMKCPSIAAHEGPR